MTPDELTESILKVLRNQFYGDRTEKEFLQEEPRLKEAITYPAAWLKAREAHLSSGRYIQILQEIIRIIQQKGNTRHIRYFSVYFLSCVQAHMSHHGDRYYEEAKTPRHIDGAVKKALRGLHNAPAGDNTVTVLAQVNAALKSRGVRKNKSTKSAKAVQLDFL